jgi:hypothetical protein
VTITLAVAEPFVPEGLGANAASAIVPVLVIGPPVRPVPVATFVTPAGAGVPNS